MLKRSIISSSGPTVWVGDEPQTCFACGRKRQAISIQSSVPMFEPLEGRPCTHLCTDCAATVASSSIELIHSLLRYQTSLNGQVKSKKR